MTETRVFSPELLPRRGETYAWLLTLAVAVGVVMLARTGSLSLWSLIFAVFMLFAAGSISLGNWMDRHTRITLGVDFVQFTNGLRHVRLSGTEVCEVRVLPARWGETVQVIGKRSHFEFNTLGEVRYQGQLAGRVGFTSGQEILEGILAQAGLSQQVARTDGRYYSRS